MGVEDAKCLRLATGFNDEDFDVLQDEEVDTVLGDNYGLYAWEWDGDENSVFDIVVYGTAAALEPLRADVEAGKLAEMLHDHVFPPPPPRYEGPKTQHQAVMAALMGRLEETMFGLPTEHNYEIQMLYGQRGMGLDNRVVGLQATLGNTDTYPGIAMSSYDVFRAPAACECGAAKCGSAIHSPWCPAAPGA